MSFGVNVSSPILKNACKVLQADYAKFRTYSNIIFISSYLQKLFVASILDFAECSQILYVHSIHYKKI